MRKEAFLDKILGSLFGGAAGDAMGYPNNYVAGSYQDWLFTQEQSYEQVQRLRRGFAEDHPGKLDVIKWVLFDDRTLGICQQELERDDGTGMGTDH
mgnify:FL=1